MAESDYQKRIDHIASQCIASRWRAANRAISSIYDEALRPLGIKVSQFNILIATAKMGVARARDVGAHLRLEASTLSRNVERMRSSGWLETVADPSDARSQPFRVTRAGRKLIEAGYPRWVEAQRQVSDWLGSEGHLLLSHLDKRPTPTND